MRTVIAVYHKGRFWLRSRRFYGALALSLALLACGAKEARQQQFQLEKTYFRAQKITDAILINPRIAPTKDFGEAIALYRQVVAKADSSMADSSAINLIKLSLMRVAELEMLQQRIDRAIATYQEILKRFYADDDEVTVAARLALGMLHERSFVYQDAIDAYAGLLPNFSSRLDPDNPNGYLLSVPFQFARLSQAGQYGAQNRNASAQAMEIYRQLLAKWPNTKTAVLATNYLAALMAEQQQWDELGALLNQKIASAQDSTHRPEYLYWKGLLLHNHLGQAAAALQVFQDFVETYPKHALVPQVRFEVAKITMKQKKLDEARALLKTIVKDYRQIPDVAAAAREALARSYESEGRWDEAINEYRFLAKEFETTPSGLAAMFYIARYYTERREPELAETAYQEAITFYQEIIRKYPQSLVAAIAQEQIANCFLTQKKWDEAVAAASNINEILDNSVGRISTYLLLGNIYEVTGQPKLAVKAYQEFIAQFPQHPLAGTLKEKVQRLMRS